MCRSQELTVVLHQPTYLFVDIGHRTAFWAELCQLHHHNCSALFSLMPQCCSIGPMPTNCRRFFLTYRMILTTLPSHQRQINSVYICLQRTGHTIHDKIRAALKRDVWVCRWAVHLGDCARPASHEWSSAERPQAESAHRTQFLPLDAMHSAHYTVARFLSVRPPSVCHTPAFSRNI